MAGRTGKKDPARAKMFPRASAMKKTTRTASIKNPIKTESTKKLPPRGDDGRFRKA